MPWQVADNATAEAACGATGKRLCTPEEWQTACKGPDGTAYSYGSTYKASACNGIDAFGRQNFHLVPTGSFPDCTNEWGVFDMNGNLWEHVAGGSDMRVRGGAHNCSDSAALHRCDYVPGNWSPSARGFRCCLTPATGTGLDGGSDDADAQAGDGGGCIEDAAITEPDVGRDTRSVERSNYEVGSSGSCPPEMAPVGAVCVDRYEASREDATPTSAGSKNGKAVSQSGVLPWYVKAMSATAFGEFDAACQAAGKRLCGSNEWFEACTGPEQTVYAFGDTWDPLVCNSVETHCQRCCDILGLTSCRTGENCGYDSALSSAWLPETCFVTADYGRDSCHVCFHVMPTGSFPGCTNELGLFDVNGNVWEVVTAPSSEDSRGYMVRGGAFNAGSPASRFKCTFNARWEELYAGFRCCKDRPLN
jgi:formylglycine-generating enzyme required for sulfatase activity